ncbi:unnamed protein product, partial [Ectocarpus sp. 12 AP-2014]
MFSHQERQKRIRGSAMAGSARIMGALACLVSISAAASTAAQQAFLSPASSWFTARRPDRHSAMMTRKGTSMMSAVASETAVADAASGV